MRKRGLYPKLAATNLKKNPKFYLPYLISMCVTAAMFYIMCSVLLNEGIGRTIGAAALSQMLTFGAIIIGIFSCIFMVYTNSFISKRRMSEFGLYSVLGMEKRHIASVLLYESVFTFLIGTAAGLVTGVLFDKLVTMILCEIMKFEIQLTFHVSLTGMLITAILFASITAVCLIANIIRIGKSDTISLLNSSRKGEREPKTKVLLAILGLLFLAGGYAISILTESAVTAIAVFFIAVLLVILGTYCLFIAGSIFVLKLLRKNKKYYYKPSHFCSVSGMLYRMKRNAAGLASICILSTMVLVTVSTTVSLYAATENTLNTQFPTDIIIQRLYSPGEDLADGVTEDLINEFVEKEGGSVKSLSSFRYLGKVSYIKDGVLSASYAEVNTSNPMRMVAYVTAGGYEELSGIHETVEKNSIIVCSNDEGFGPSLQIGDTTYTVVKTLSSFPDISSYNTYTTPMTFVIVSDDETFDAIHAYYKELTDDVTYLNAVHEYRVNFDNPIETEEVLTDNLSRRFSEIQTSHNGYTRIFSRKLNGQELFALYGSFLFIGIVLGALFLMVTVMIIYYKQVTEGYEDKESFNIMSKVGMSDGEIAKTVHSQVLTVFLLPLIAAFCHLAFAFPMISKLLLLFQLTDTGIFITALCVTAAVFALIYGAVYLITSRTYYRIVK